MFIDFAARDKLPSVTGSPAKAMQFLRRVGAIVAAATRGNFSVEVTPREQGFALLAIAGLFLFLFGPTLQAKFYIVEDHLVLEALSWGVADWIDYVANDARLFQRVRPGYWLYRAWGASLFGSNPHLWHGAALTWGIFTCFLFYLAFRELGADMATSLVLVLLLVLGGNQNWIWINLIPQETMAMLFTAAAVWAIARASREGASRWWDLGALVAMALAGLVKESFVILIPALLLLRLACHRASMDCPVKESLRALRAPLTAGVLIFLAELALVVAVLSSNIGGYAGSASGLSASSFDPVRWYQLLSSQELGRFLWLPLAVWAGFLLLRPSQRVTLVLMAVVFGAWVVPQLVLYSNGLNERYLFPAIAAIAGSIAFAMASLLRQPKARILWFVALLLLLPALADGVKATTRTAGWFKAETLAANRLVEFLAQNVPSDKVILMAGDPGTPVGFEATYTLPRYLELAGSTSRFYLWPLVSKGLRSDRHIEVSKGNAALRYPGNLTPSDVGGIIIVDTFSTVLHFEPLMQWLEDSSWQEQVFGERFHSFSVCPSGYQEAGEVVYRALLPTARSSPSRRTLVAVDSSIADSVSTSPLLDTPPWGLERDFAAPGATLWLGPGDAEGLAVSLTSTRPQTVTVGIEAVPGPSRPDPARTVELSLINSGGEQAHRRTFDGEHWEFDIKLRPGANRIRLRVMDEPTVAVLSNGDTRRLMAFIRRITIRGLPSTSAGN